MFKKIFLFFFYGEFLGAPVVRTLCFHCQQLRSHNLHSVVKKKFFFFITQIERAKEKSVLKKKKKKARENYQSAQDGIDPILPASLHQV